MRAILQKLKESDQDFEWYPTTDEMIRVVFKRCGEFKSVLDVGAGDGRVLTKLAEMCKDADRCEPSLYAVEKSLVHIENMPEDVSIIGTDFMMQSLMDKKADLVFCNPPYSEYEAWAVKVIQEAYANNAVLILPQRWQKSKLIKDALKKRKAVSKVLWSSHFLDADRQARAFVDIIRINLLSEDRWGHDKKRDPFDVWFDDVFPEFDKAETDHLDDIDRSSRAKKFKFDDIVVGQNLIERLHEFYINDMDELLKTYQALSEIDANLLDELGIKKKAIKQGLRSKIEGTKNLYWKELFSRLEKITHRLTAKTRNEMLEKMRSCGNIDYTAENAYAVVIWAIKNANKYINRQLVDLFQDLSTPECVKRYKSNKKVWENESWRYLQHHGKMPTHYSLEYRVILENRLAIYNKKNDYFDTHYPNGLHDRCHSLIGDVITVANNLGFFCYDHSKMFTWESGKPNEFYCSTVDAEADFVLMRVKAFKNGNLHIQFSQEFIKSLNVEASRLLGWIKTPQQAVDEMGLDLAFVQSKFRSNTLLTPAEGQLLLTA